MALAITGWSFDQASYSPGSAINVTVTYTSDDLQAAASLASNLTVTVADTTPASVTQPSTGAVPYPQFTVATPGTNPLPTTVTAADDRPVPGVWALTSNVFAAGTTAPFTGTAVLSSTA